MTMRPTTDDGSRRSADLLTPGDLAPREDVPLSQGFDGDPGFDGVLPTLPAGDVLAPTVTANKGSLSMLEDLVRANAAGIAALREMMRANAANITVLSNTVTTTSLQLKSMSAALTDATETAARAYRLASNAQTTITGQGVTLGTLAANVSTLTSDIDDLCVRMDPKVLRRVSRILIKKGLHFANLFYIFE